MDLPCVVRFCRPLKIQGEEPGEDCLMVDGFGVFIVPAVAISDDSVEAGVATIQPRWPGVA